MPYPDMTEAELDYLGDLMKRIAELEIKSVSRIKPVDAKDYSLHWQDDFPYFTNRWIDTLPEEGAPQDMQNRVITVEGLLVTGHVVEGMRDGAAERMLYKYAPLVDMAFELNPYLLLSEEDQGIYDMVPGGAEFTRSNGLQIFVNTAVPGMPSQIGTRFRWNIGFSRNDDRAY